MDSFGLCFLKTLTCSTVLTPRIHIFAKNRILGVPIQSSTYLPVTALAGVVADVAADVADVAAITDVAAAAAAAVLIFGGRVQVEADGQQRDEGGDGPDGGDGGRDRPTCDPLSVLKGILDMHISEQGKENFFFRF